MTVIKKQVFRPSRDENLQQFLAKDGAEMRWGQPASKNKAKTRARAAGKIIGVPEKEGDAAKKAPPKAEPKSPWDDESDALDQGSDNSNSADDRTKEIKNAVEDAYFEKAFEVTPEGVARKLPPRRPAQEKWGKTTQSARDKDAKQVREARQEVRESTSGSKSGNIPKSIGQKIRRKATQSYIRGRKATDVGDRGVGEATQRMKRSAEAGRNFSQVNAPAGTKWGEPYIKNAVQDAWFDKATSHGGWDETPPTLSHGGWDETPPTLSHGGWGGTPPTQKIPKGMGDELTSGKPGKKGSGDTAKEKAPFPAVAAAGRKSRGEITSAPRRDYLTDKPGTSSGRAGRSPSKQAAMKDADSNRRAGQTPYLSESKERRKDNEISDMSVYHKKKAPTRTPGKGQTAKFREGKWQSKMQKAVWDAYFEKADPNASPAEKGRRNLEAQKTKAMRAEKLESTDMPFSSVAPGTQNTPQARRAGTKAYNLNVRAGAPRESARGVARAARHDTTAGGDNWSDANYTPPPKPKG